MAGQTVPVENATHFERPKAGKVVFPQAQAPRQPAHKWRFLEKSAQE